MASNFQHPTTDAELSEGQVETRALRVNSSGMAEQHDLETIAFPTLSEEQIAQLGRYAGAPSKKFRAGVALFRHGEREFKFFVVKSGELEIVDETGDKP